MKKTIALILSFMLILSLAAACTGNTKPADTSTNEQAETKTDDANTTTPDNSAPATNDEQPAEADAQPVKEDNLVYGGDKFVGIWYDTMSQRAVLSIVPTNIFGVYSVMLHWGGSANTFAEWDMTATYDDSTDEVSYTDGAHYEVELNKNGDEDRKTISEGAEGKLYFDGDKLLWTDNKEEVSAEMSFEKSTSAAPSVEILSENYFKPIANLHDDESGAVLKKAKAAYDAISFADSYVIWCNDTDELKANLKEAYATLSDDEKALFEDNLFSVQGIVVDAAVNWSDYSYLFEDSGVSEDMQRLVNDNRAMESFNRLFDNTIFACLAD